MATKKCIKEILNKLNLTEQDMDKFWKDLYSTNFIVRNLTDHGKSWRDMNTSAIADIPTRKEKDLIASEEKRLKEEKAEKERLKREAEEKYYSEHFDEVMASKIDNREELTEKEIRKLVFEYSKHTDCGENRRWSRSVTTIIGLLDRTFAINWEEGLTEVQENEFYNQPYEVRLNQYEKTITVTEWEKV